MFFLRIFATCVCFSDIIGFFTLPNDLKVFYVFYSVIFPFLRVYSPFDSLDWGLTRVRATASYLNEGLVARTML